MQRDFVPHFALPPPEVPRILPKRVMGSICLERETRNVKRLLSADVHHRARGWSEAGLADVVPLFLVLHNSRDEFPQFIIAIATSHAADQIVVGG
jgi:hypothetical protein